MGERDKVNRGTSEIGKIERGSETLSLPLSLSQTPSSSYLMPESSLEPTVEKARFIFHASVVTVSFSFVIISLNVT